MRAGKSLTSTTITPSSQLGPLAGEEPRRTGSIPTAKRSSVKSVLERFGRRFPLLIKFIDARDYLSIQVHPDDALGLKRHNSFGKTEMWYVINATPGAKLYSGFAVQSSPEDYVRRIEEGTMSRLSPNTK